MRPTCCIARQFCGRQRTQSSGITALVTLAGDVTSNDGRLRIAVKDNICTSSLPTTCSSAMLYHYHSPFDATSVRLLREAGAHIIGKANCDEFGMGSLNVNSVHGPVINPFQAHNALGAARDHGERRSAGGSSGGSAASVAAGICDAALGTDTGGSVRLPASYCGVVGLKPSYGLISRFGVISFADSLDCVGVLGNSVDIVKQVFNSVSVYDPKDPTAATDDLRKKARLASDPYIPALTSSLEGLRIGVPQEYFPSELDPSIVHILRTVLRRLEAAGASLIPVSIPATKFALSAYYVIASAEASSNLARFDGVRYGFQAPTPSGTTTTKTSDIYALSRSKGFGKEVQKRILLGTYALTADAFDNYFLQAQRVRTRIKEGFNKVFRIPCVQSALPSPPENGVDILIHPSAIRTAPPLDNISADDDGLSGLGEYLQDVMTVPVSLAGLPALSVPAGLGADGWPVGVSVVGQWGCDGFVLRVGEAIEKLC
ncbi:amidase signature enzyme [Scleroderma citrinum]